jgi:HSP20 family protein
MSSQGNNNNANTGTRPPRPEDFFASFFPGLNPPTGNGVDHRGNDFFAHLAGAFQPPPHARSWGGPAFGGDFDDWNPWLHHGRLGEHRRGGPNRHGHGHSHGPGPRGRHARDEQHQHQEPPAPPHANEDAPDPAEVTPDEDSPSSSPGGPRQCPRRAQPFDPWANMAQRVGEAMKNHPLFQEYNNVSTSTSDGNQRNTDNDVECFTPPLDLFDAVTAYTLHIPLPGAKKEDVGISFDPEMTKLSVSGVIHRPGNEEFQKTLVGKGERTVGLFKREVELKDEVDAVGITAKMEDGILIVTVPKVEKGWTEIHKIEIE